MKKIVTALVLLILALSLFSCAESENTLSVDSVYFMAQKAGYEGSIEDFIAEFKGDKGDRGEAGAPGDKGDAGSRWFCDDGNPEASLGSDGDYYLALVTYDIYAKSGGQWQKIGNIKGASSADEETKTATARALLSTVVVSSSSYDGSGVIYKIDKSSGSAYIITNYHVVYDDAKAGVSTDIKIMLYGMEYDGYAIPATLVGTSATHDIALIKVENSDLISESNAMAAIFSDSDEVMPLDRAIAVGNPKAMGLAATDGTVSVDSEYVSVKMTDTLGSTVVRCMRIDTPINKGNSGGGLYNSLGLLIGVVNAKKSDAAIDNIAYAIPSNLVSLVAENILRYCDGTSATTGRCISFGITPKIYKAYTEYDEESGELKKIEKISVKECAPGSLSSKYLMKNDVIRAIEIDGVTYEITREYHAAECALRITYTSKVVYHITRGGVDMSIEIPVDSATFLAI